LQLKFNKGENMEKLTLKETINQISQAFAALDAAKEDCKDVVESALSAYLEEIPAEYRKTKIMAARKTEVKNIKKLAKAMMKGGKAGVAEETANMDELLNAIG